MCFNSPVLMAHLKRKAGERGFFLWTNFSMMLGVLQLLNQLALSGQHGQ